MTPSQPGSGQILNLALTELHTTRLQLQEAQKIAKGYAASARRSEENRDCTNITIIAFGALLILAGAFIVLAANQVFTQQVNVISTTFGLQGGTYFGGTMAAIGLLLTIGIIASQIQARRLASAQQAD